MTDPNPPVTAVGDEDLDDLDDILDEFENTPAKATSIPENPVVRSDAVEPKDAKTLPAMEDDFTSQLQAGMADLMKELETSPEARQQFEGLVSEISQATSSRPVAKEESLPGPKNFQDTITQTMERMKESGKEADQAASTSSETNDFLAEMLKQLEGAAGGEGGEGDFSSLLMGMMEQLTSKEVLYEPMKDLNDKFPTWMLKNDHKLSVEEKERYSTQQKYVREITIRFEEPSYSDENEVSRQYIVERMQKMQELGSPPADIMADLANGLEMDENGMPKLPPELDSNCPVS